VIRISLNVPLGYRLLGKLDPPTKNRATSQGVCSLLLLLLFLAVLALVADVIRHDFSSFAVLGEFNSASLIQQLLIIGWCVGILGVGICMHELIHGCFIWSFSGKRPRFGFRARSLRPYAALRPNAHVSRKQGLVIALAPLAVITILGTATLPFVPVVAISALVLVVSANAAGAVEDLRVFLWLLKHRGDMRWGFDGSSNLAYEPAERAQAA